MRETNFINQNKKKWQEFESALDKTYHDPDRLSEQFIQITDDLSYARTFYPNRSVRVYLNSLAQRIFSTIYKNRRSPLKRIGLFWLEELPQLVYEARREFLLAFLTMLISFVIGIVSSAGDPQFVNTILGDGYVEMTIENIESGDPMAVYKQRGQFGMSLGITANNLFVAFLTFVMGVFFAVGSIALIIKNGIMVGAFQYFFIERGLFWDSFLTIWIHGTLEISAIVIAGAAGITMGKGLVFPGTYTRMQSFQRSARRGVKIMIGIAPIIIMAGFIEGYLTRHTDTPNIVRGLFIFVCLAFILIYFVWYPYIRAKAGFTYMISDAKIPPDKAQAIDFTRVKSSGEIFAEMFTFYKKHFSKIILLSLLNALIFTGVTVLASGGKPANTYVFSERMMGMLLALQQFFTPINYLSFLHLFIFWVLMVIVFHWLHQEASPLARLKLSRTILLKTLIPFSFPGLIVATQYWFVEFSNFYLLLAYLLTFGALIIGIFYWLKREASSSKIDSYRSIRTLIYICLISLIGAIRYWFIVFLVILSMPLVFTWVYGLQTERLNVFQGFIRAIGLLWSNVGRITVLMVILSLFGLLLFLFTDSMIFSFYFNLFSWVLPLEDVIILQLQTGLLIFLLFFILYFIFIMFVIGFGILYYILREIKDATHLRTRIQEIGVAKRIKGLEQEG